MSDDMWAIFENMIVNILFASKKSISSNYASKINIDRPIYRGIIFSKKKTSFI